MSGRLERSWRSIGLAGCTICVVCGEPAHTCDMCILVFASAWLDRPCCRAIPCHLCHAAVGSVVVLFHIACNRAMREVLLCRPLSLSALTGAVGMRAPTPNTLSAFGAEMCGTGPPTGDGFKGSRACVGLSLLLRRGCCAGVCQTCKRPPGCVRMRC